jgi:hypothetical protein
MERKTYLMMKLNKDLRMLLNNMPTKLLDAFALPTRILNKEKVVQPMRISKRDLRFMILSLMV